MTDYFAYKIARAIPQNESALLEWWLPLSLHVKTPLA